MQNNDFEFIYKLKNNENSANLDFQEQASFENLNRSEENGAFRRPTREWDTSRDDISRENNGAGDNTIREISRYGRGGDSQRTDIRGTTRRNSALDNTEIRTNNGQPMELFTRAGLYTQQESQESSNYSRNDRSGGSKGGGHNLSIDSGTGAYARRENEIGGNNRPNHIRGGSETTLFAQERERILADGSGSHQNEIQRLFQSTNDRVDLLLRSEFFQETIARLIEDITISVRKKIYGETQYSRDLRGSTKEVSRERGVDLSDNRESREQVSRRDGGSDRGANRIRGEGLFLYQGDDRGVFSREQEHQRDDNKRDQESNRTTSEEPRAPETRREQGDRTLFSLDSQALESKRETEPRGLGDNIGSTTNIEKTASRDEGHNNTHSAIEVSVGGSENQRNNSAKQTSSGADSQDLLSRESADTTTASTISEDAKSRTFRTFSDREFYTRFTEGVEYRGQVDFNLSPKERFLSNIEAIKLSQQILSEKRLLATEPEQEILARFSGFGGLKKFLDEDEKGNQELRNLVGQEKLLEIYASADTAFYTPQSVIDDIYKGLNNFGVTKDLPRIRALEPSCGIGSFLARAPENYEFEAIEKDVITAT